MTFVVTPAHDRNDSPTSRPGTMPHLMQYTAVVPGHTSPFSCDTTTQISPTSAVPLPSDPRQLSAPQRPPGRSASGRDEGPQTDRSLLYTARRSSSIYESCSHECCIGNSQKDQNSNDHSSLCSSPEAHISLSNGTEGHFSNKKTVTCSESGNTGQARKTTSQGFAHCVESNSKESTTTKPYKSDIAEETTAITGGSTMQFDSAEHCNAAAWPPVASSKSSGSSDESGQQQLFRADGTVSEQQLRELRLLCRLIGLHSRPRLQKGQRINVYLHGSRMATGKGGLAPGAATAVANIAGACGAAAACNLGLGFSPSSFLKRTGSYDNPLGLSPSEEIKVLGGVDIGANTKCLFFLNDNEDHLYICFNWFDPKSVLDIASLSCRVASTFRLQPTDSTTTLNEDTTLDQVPFLEAARRSALTFWNHPEFQELLKDGGAVLKPSVPPAGGNAGGGQQDEPQKQSSRPPLRRASYSSNLQAITCGGFSIGGPTAFYIASLLSVHISPDVPVGSKYRQHIRAVAFGSPRFCGEKFVRWSEQHLAPSSCTVVLYSRAQQSHQKDAREQLQEQLQKHQHAWGESSLNSGVTAAVSSEHHDDKTKREQRMILDPVCVQGSADEGFVVQPNTVLLRVGGGLMRMGKQDEAEAATAAEEVSLDSSRIMWNMATRVSPFTKAYNERYAMLHSVLRYYEALADT